METKELKESTNKQVKENNKLDDILKRIDDGIMFEKYVKEHILKNGQ